MRLCSVLNKFVRLQMQTKQKNILILLLLFTCVEISTINTYEIDRLTKEPNVIKSVKQSKRDLSLSYAATNIDSKEGTRVKTITVIKNIGKKHEKYAINPDMHKNENWADAFRDNFDSYGTIPDVPDIDDLFEFMNKQKKPVKPTTENTLHNSPKMTLKNNNNNSNDKNNKNNDNGKVDSKGKPVKEMTDDFDNVAIMSTKTHNSNNKNVTNIQSNVEKIEGDAELLPHSNKRFANNNNNLPGRSESISALEFNGHGGSSSNTKQRLIDVNYSTPQHTVHQYFDNYIQIPNVGIRDNSQGYDYIKPCAANTQKSINIATPSGRSYDIPAVNGRNTSGIINPYLAPSVTKRPQQSAPQQPQPQLPPTQLLPAQISIQFPSQINFTPNITNTLNRAPFSVNSLVTPLQQQQPQQQSALPTQQPQQQQVQIQVTSTPPANADNNSNNNNNNNGNQTPFPQNIYTTTQRPYMAPSLRNGLTFSRGQPSYAVAFGRNRNNNMNSYRPGIFSYGPMRAIYSRSRGLKY